VGSGTLDAAGGCYFSDVVPLPDDDSAGQKLNKKSLQGLAEDVETVCACVCAVCCSSMLQWQKCNTKSLQSLAGDVHTVCVCVRCSLL